MKRGTVKKSRQQEMEEMKNQRGGGMEEMEKEKRGGDNKMWKTWRTREERLSCGQRYSVSLQFVTVLYTAVFNSLRLTMHTIPAFDHSH